tara:strand:- start:857 stop:1405 length:549 start_codon:yes stop_codon:yes gene_type:complete
MEINMTNYAPDPKKERIYSDLATIPLSEVTAEQIETLTNPVTLSASNQDALITMGIVNKAAMRDGSSMPATGRIINITASDAGANYDILVPAKGEVWQIIGISYIVSGISGTLSHLVYMNGTYSGAAGGSVVISEKSSSDAGDNFGDVDYNPLHIDENLKIAYTFYGTATSVSVRCACIRIR